METLAIKRSREKEISIRLSVVIPAYNAAWCIRKAITAAACQTLRPYEIVVVDDGSCDDTHSIVKSLAAEQPELSLRYLPLSKRSGPSAARNMGWNAATGEYIAFLDADDSWHPRKLEYMATMLTTHQELDLLGHTFLVTTEKETLPELPPQNELPPLQPIRWLSLLLHNVLQTSCVVVRRSLTERFDETMQHNEDHEFVCRIAQDYRVALLPLALTQRSRPVLASGGHSENIYQMRYGELRTYVKLTWRRPMWLPALPLLCTFSIVKHLRKTRTLRRQQTIQSVRKKQNKPSAILFSHFYPPDDVISGRLFADLATDLVRRGWKVRILTSNGLYCKPKTIAGPSYEKRDGINIYRAWRLPLPQSKHLARLVNAIWVLATWSWNIFRLPSADAYLVGSDPQFSQLLFPAIRLLRPHSRIVFWCHDLFPDTLVALYQNSRLITNIIRFTTRKLLQHCYRYTDVVIALGPCMTARITAYNHKSTMTTITPWALLEPTTPLPANTTLRKKTFGDATLVLLYSGNLGHAHEFVQYLHLADALAIAVPKAIVAFGCRGNRVASLKTTIKTNQYKNVRQLDFVSEEALPERLAIADFHLVSLRHGWEGIVVPSKFFGSLAVGRPVIYAGHPDTALALWIREFNLGMVLTQETFKNVVIALTELAQNPHRLTSWNCHVQSIYHSHFSRKSILDRFVALLKSR